VPPRREAVLLDTLAGAVRGLAKAEARGDLASLRRLDLRAPTGSAFYRLIARHAPEVSQPSDLRNLALILAIMALNPEGLVPGGLGRALAEADISEARVQRLLTARGEIFRDLALRTARVLARAGSLPYRDLGLLVLSRSETFADEIRMRIAREYWGRRSPEPTEANTATD
jgi:CRISPR system Cascade subunit CasB